LIVATHSDQTSKVIVDSSNTTSMLTFHPGPQGNAMEFTIDWILATKTLETIKSTLNKEKMEFHHGLCNKFELNDIMTHCLMVVHKIDGQVGESDHDL
jgi:hypothetical protein